MFVIWFSERGVNVLIAGEGVSAIATPPADQAERERTGQRRHPKPSSHQGSSVVRKVVSRTI
jgi:hypothetical protein